MNNKPIKSIDDLEEFLEDWGEELGMPDADDEDAYTSECPACNWTGDIMETVFRDGEFYCPKCNHQFQSRTE
jgi:transposase